MDRRRLGGMMIVMAVTAMGWSFFGIWYGLLILGVVSLARFVERRITPKRLADVRVPRYLAVPVILLPISLAVFIVMSPNGGGGARPPDNHVSQPSATSLRGVFLVRIGPSFGGLRLAVRPGFIDWPKGFVALEGTVARVMTFLVELPPDQRLRLLSGETPWPKELVAHMGDRPGSSTVSVTRILRVVTMSSCEEACPFRGGRSGNGSSFKQFTSGPVIVLSRSHLMSSLRCGRCRC